MSWGIVAEREQGSTRGPLQRAYERLSVSARADFSLDLLLVQEQVDILDAGCAVEVLDELLATVLVLEPDVVGQLDQVLVAERPDVDDGQLAAVAFEDGLVGRDIVSGRDYGTGRFVWLENTGNFNEDWPEHSIREDMPFHPDEVHTADLNRDGRIDLVVATFREHLYFIPGPKDPVSGPWDIYLVASSEKAHGGAALADLDWDGHRDIVWGNAWYENPGDPTRVPWEKHFIDREWTTSTKIAVGDLNGDSRMEVVLCGEESDDGIAWYSSPQNPVDETWTRQVIAADYSHVHSLQLADFDLDGDPDLLAAEMHHTEGQHRVAGFECIDIKNNFWKENAIAQTGSHNAKIGDLNGDGLPDIVGKNWGGDLKAETWINATPASPTNSINA